MLGFYSSFIKRYEIDEDVREYLHTSAKKISEDHSDELCEIIKAYRASNYAWNEVAEAKNALAEPSLFGGSSVTLAVVRMRSTAA